MPPLAPAVRRGWARGCGLYSRNLRPRCNQGALGVLCSLLEWRQLSATGCRDGSDHSLLHPNGAGSACPVPDVPAGCSGLWGDKVWLSLSFPRHRKAEEFLITFPLPVPLSAAMSRGQRVFGEEQMAGMKQTLPAVKSQLCLPSQHPKPSQFCRAGAVFLFLTPPLLLFLCLPNLPRSLGALLGGLEAVSEESKPCWLMEFDFSGSRSKRMC